MRTLLAACALLAAALVYMLSRATESSSVFDAHYPWVLGLGGLLALGLLLLISVQLGSLRAKLRERVFGAKLTLRLLVVFALMALLPGVLIYLVSVQFLSRSIETWFDVRVERALEGGLNLGRTTLDAFLIDLQRKAEAMAQVMEDTTAIDEAVLLNHLREQYAVDEATLLTTRGKVLAFSGNERVTLLPEPLGAPVMRAIRVQRTYRAVEQISGRGLYLRVVLPLAPLSLNEELRALQVMQPVPAELARDAEKVESVYRNYRELSVSRQGIKRIYGLTLTLTLLLTLLFAIALAVLLSQKLSAPLGMLAQSARAIGKGDFSKLNPVTSRDELGLLTQSFNTMTRRLAETSDSMEKNRRELQATNAYLESVLSNLSAGVLLLDDRFRLRSANLSAAEILGVKSSGRRGGTLGDWSRGAPGARAFATAIEEEFQRTGPRWQRQIEYAGAAGTRTLLVRGTRLPTAGGDDHVIVFDDVTELIAAQRDAAWGEVARRLAHEIKNPLTPIQLAAERLQLKLSDKLPPGDAGMLARSTATIVNQVGALKDMVDDFSEYARASRMNAESVDLNRLVRDVMVLYDSLGPKVQLELADGLPRIDGDVVLLRQVINNLMQNALDALSGTEQPRVVVRTMAHDGGVRFDVVDNGTGFSQELLGRVFEPYVTTKPKGTGLGLAIVKKIVEQHRGQVHIANVDPHGARVSIALPAAAAVPLAARTG